MAQKMDGYITLLITLYWLLLSTRQWPDIYLHPKLFTKHSQRSTVGIVGCTAITKYGKQLQQQQQQQQPQRRNQIVKLSTSCVGGKSDYEMGNVLGFWRISCTVQVTVSYSLEGTNISRRFLGCEQHVVSLYFP